MSLLKEFRIYHKGEGLFTPRLFYCGWCYKDMVESIPCLCCTLLMLIRMCDFSWIKHISFQSFFCGGWGGGGCRGHQFHNLNCNIECRIMSQQSLFQNDIPMTRIHNFDFDTICWIMSRATPFQNQLVMSKTLKFFYDIWYHNYGFDTICQTISHTTLPQN